MAVLRPLRVVIDNYPEGQVEEMEAVNNPEDAAAGTRKVPFSRVLYIEQDDFREDPPKQYFRLSPGREVRLRYGYFITCTGVVKDEKGEVVEIHCTYDPATRGGNAPDGRKVKSTIHWVSAAHAVDARSAPLRQPLHARRIPNEMDEGQDFTANLNPELARSADRREAGAVACATPTPGGRYQFERLGYFCVDPDSTPGKPVFNRTVALRDTWAKIEKARARRPEAMIILGIGGILGDAASAILKDGELVAAVEESKLTGGARTGRARRTNCPEQSIATCLELAGATPEQVDAVAVVRPFPPAEARLPPASCARSFPTAGSWWWSITGARRVGLLSHRPSTRPRC